MITGYVYWGIRLPGISRNFLKNRKNGKKKRSQKEKAKEERKTAETPAEGKSRSIDSVSKQKAEKAVPKEKSSDVSEGREKTKEKDSGDNKNE